MYLFQNTLILCLEKNYPLPSYIVREVTIKLAMLKTLNTTTTNVVPDKNF